MLALSAVFEVQREHAIPALDLAIRNDFPLETAGDVEERVDTPELRLDRGHRLLRRRQRRQVDAANDERIRAEPLGEAFGGGLGVIDERDRGAALRRRLGDHAAQRAESAGDDDRLALHCGLPSLTAWDSS